MVFSLSSAVVSEPTVVPRGVEAADWAELELGAPNSSGESIRQFGSVFGVPGDSGYTTG